MSCLNLDLNTIHVHYKNVASINQMLRQRSEKDVEIESVIKTGMAVIDVGTLSRLT